MHSTIEVKAHASKLREALGGLGHELKHSQCLEAVSKMAGYPDWNTYTAALGVNQQRAEQFLDEVLDAEAELSYTKFIHRFEVKYLVDFTENDFLKDMREIREEFGDYVSREFMGCISGEKQPDDNRYPNHVRYVWRGFFEKNEVLMTVGIYCKDDTHYTCEVRY